ncbi:MAG TPA: hypothetical protein VL485_20365, partial [Ktedonobacteraceae bacterium]|nr:hypothetical protein [Ktedonobacteraceae bacterium]
MAFDGLRKIRCPFCAREYRLGEFAVFSGTTGTITKEAPKTFWQHLSSTIRAPQLEGKENVLARNLRRCPNCGGILPFNIEYVEDNITIAVIGDTFSGKSHFIAAAIQNLKERRVPHHIRLAGFSAADTRIESMYRNTYYEPLFVRNETLQQNQAAIKPLDEPLIYEMRIAGRRVNLLFYDAAGEDIAQIDTRVTNKPHILNARAMIFLADPWSMPGFVDQLAHHLRPGPNFITGRMSVDVLNNVIEVFKRVLGQAREIQFSLPVAITLSKSDLIPYVVTPSGDPLYQSLADPQYPSMLNRAESDGIHQVVRRFLIEVGEKSLVDMEQTI